MALFEQKIWTDRQVQFPARRKLTNVNTQEEKTVLVERNEGIIYEEGNLFDAASINDLEERVAVAFAAVEEAALNRVNLYYPVGKIFMAVTNLHLEDPEQTVFPGTTWLRLENRVLLPVDPEIANSEETGGSNTLQVTVSAKTISANTTIANTSLNANQIPKHYHSGEDSYETYSDSSIGYQLSGGITLHYNTNDSWTHDVATANASSGSSHGHGVSNQKISFAGTAVKNINNMQKYITVYAWRRVG